MHKRAVQAATFAVSLMAGSAFAGIAAPADVPIKKMAVTQSPTDTFGDPACGRNVFAGSKLGSFPVCFANSEMAEHPFHGEIARSADRVGGCWGAGEVRAFVVNSKELFGDEAIMPVFRTLDAAGRVAEDFHGRTILSARNIGDAVANQLML